MVKDDILNYRPDVNSNINSIDTVESVEEETEDVGYGYEYSHILISLNVNKPSALLIKYDEMIKHIDSFLDNIKKELVNSREGSLYFNIDSINEKNDLYNTNFHDCKGNTLFETYECLLKIKEDQVKIKDKIIELIYGKDVDSKSAIEIDEELISKIQYCEREGLYQNINYFYLYYIVQVVSLFNSYHTSLMQTVCSLGFLNDNNLKPIKKKKIDDNIFNAINKKFNNINKLLLFDLNKDKCIDNILNISHNIFALVEEHDLFLDSYSSLINTCNDDITFYVNLRQNDEDNINSSVEDLYKVLNLYVMCKEDILSQLVEKSKIRGVFL